MYTVVEQTCETCGEVNTHLTAQCSARPGWLARLWGTAFAWADTLAYVVGRLA
jgi:hypothetical protein